MAGRSLGADLNLLLLFCVAFIPFPTGVLAEARIDQPDESTALVFYAATFFVTGLIFNLLWRYPAKRAPWLLAPDAHPREVATITAASPMVRQPTSSPRSSAGSSYPGADSAGANRRSLSRPGGAWRSGGAVAIQEPVFRCSSSA